MKSLVRIFLMKNLALIFISTVLGTSQSTTTNLSSDGIYEGTESGLGSPGDSVEYSVETIGGVNCICVETARLNRENGESLFKSKECYDGYVSGSG